MDQNQEGNLKRWVSLPSLKLGEGEEDKELMVAEKDMSKTKVLRLNLSEIYQYLNAKSILHEMVERKLITSQQKGNAEAYSSAYAQNISAGVALFETGSSPTVALDLCTILEATDFQGGKKLAMKLTSDHDNISAIKKKQVMQRFYPPPTTTPPSELKVSDLQSQFLQTLAAVMEAFEQLPDSLSRLKQFFSRLVLPMGEGKVIPIVNRSTYKNAASTEEMLRCQPSPWNCFSPHLLMMMSVECQCPQAIEPVEQFLQYRSKCASSLICRRTKLLTKASNMTTSHSPSHLACHTAPVNDLQSLHPSVFDERKNPERLQTIRVTVQVDRPHLTLQDYDDITTAVCGFFHIPRVALVYAGCSEDGQVVSWNMSTALLPYLKRASSGVSSDRLMAEQRILGVAAGDLQYHCLSVKEVELFEAAFYGLEKRVQSLILQKVSINCVDKDGRTPLYIASRKAHGAVVKLLLQQHADASICKKNGWTPLMAASFSGHTDVVQTLIEAKAQINTQEENDWTALHLAAQEGKVDVVRLLTEAQALVNIQTEDGMTPLYIASDKGHGAVVKLLLQQHADVSICTKTGWTPLMTASFNGHTDVVRTLIEAKAQINTQKKDDVTALHLASAEGKVDVVRLLTEAQALVNLQTKWGRRPIDIARSRGHSEIVEILQKM
ncbi:Ankyrin repeat domain-containing protein 29 [Geodia barretti]|uniref:Ankyrin repeat domain-containing protein 29 n=1 Tax=Geodia barretti TaxID=519541 RepID=A0AA35SAT8_GEOBA|nr:Ankyrin repeat domain-containing protein 29 [Geodia barretti]